MSAAVAGAPIAFYDSPSDSVGTPYVKNPAVVKPATIFMAPDGHWVIDKLRWTGWGDAVAHGAGSSTASNCNPSCATGTWTSHAARVTLSKAETVAGHRVYACLQVTVTAAPRSDVNKCLKRQKVGYAYVPVSTASRTTTATKSVRFFTPSRNIQCALSGSGAFCVSLKPPAMASVTALGRTYICQHQGAKCTGNFGDEPGSAPPRELAYGASITIGPLRCSSAFAGLTCVVKASGKGFFMSAQSVRAVP